MDQVKCAMNVGSKICPIRKSMVGSQLEILVTCLKQCKFTLKVSTVNIVIALTNLTGQPRIFQWTEPRSINVF